MDWRKIGIFISDLSFCKYGSVLHLFRTLKLNTTYFMNTVLWGHPWRAQWWRIHLPVQETQVDPGPGKILHATQQLSPCTTTAEPALRAWEPQLSPRALEPVFTREACALQPEKSPQQQRPSTPPQKNRAGTTLTDEVIFPPVNIKNKQKKIKKINIKKSKLDRQLLIGTFYFFLL